ncbi:GNAT family N-acetyltransferase [Elizabethkingia meningoseptica]|uniref:GNAT family N-acetyltransferase n=1 Tax=Elizabethkingia meningoseptica TaxID=238 RepID=UPI0023AEAD39|nr:GNAT family N-acetyltransferase [Elizabethkingia meningoseptica]MDE5526353.1 GNAT family N-acetyltransferase [Elizabethkingia meningoseptica]
MQHIKEIDYNRFSRIYEEYLVADFPEDEVKPLWVIKKAYKAERYTAYVMEDGDEVKAYASFLWNNREILLLDYFAVSLAAGRGGGIGSLFLQELTKNIQAKGFIIECESPEKAEDEAEKHIREKRIAFYEKNGAKMTDVVARVFGVDFCLLYMPVESDLEVIDIKEEFIRIYHNTSPKSFYHKYVKIV